MDKNPVGLKFIKTNSNNKNNSIKNREFQQNKKNNQLKIKYKNQSKNFKK